MSIMIFMLITFVMTNHPLIMGFSLMMTSLLMGIILAMNAPSAWIAYMLVMIFVSGMMIIILYMSSLSSNETISTSTFFTKKYMLLYMTTFLVTYSSSYIFIMKNMFFFEDPLFSMIYKTYSQLMNPMTILIIFYLLIVLITAVNIIKVSKLPLRSIGE